MGGDGSHGVIDVIVIIRSILQSGKRILNILPMLPSCVCYGVEAALVCFLDEQLQDDPDLVGRGFTAPLFKIALV